MAPKKKTTMRTRGKEGCNVQEGAKKTADILGISLNAAALIFGTLKSVADFGCTPGLKGACGTVLGLINLVQDMIDVQDGFKALIRSICRFLVIVARYESEQGGNLNAHLTRAIEEFEEYVLPSYLVQRGPSRGALS
ncbi:hypothetical protein H1R20_g10778, partial [Candolleomyces eurysporus]